MTAARGRRDTIYSIVALISGDIVADKGKVFYLFARVRCYAGLENYSNRCGGSAVMLVVGQSESGQQFFF